MVDENQRRDSLADIRKVVDTADVSGYACRVNALGHRTSVTPSGSKVDVQSPIAWGHDRYYEIR